MRLNARQWLLAAGGALTVVAALMGSYLIAQTPSAVVGDRVDLGASPAAASNDRVAYTLAEGRSATDVGKDLERLGIIRSAKQFQVLISLMGLEEKLSAGDYTLFKGTSTASAINALTVKDAVPTIRVTFPEGIRVEEMAVIAEKAGFGTYGQFLEAVAAAQLPPDLAGAVPAGQGLQGYLFPDTYILPRGSTAADLVQLMLATFDRRFTPELRAAAAAHGLNTHQAITLAAVVEREAVLAQERPLIAGVFYNRLAEGDRLGADPTVQFAAALSQASVNKFGWWKKELTIDDLENPSKYNTRLFPGLPPGPITNPGLASIEAVANPATTKMYYFVADAKKADGSHVFAETFAEHERNIARVGQ